MEPEEDRAPRAHHHREQRTEMAKNITYPLIKVSSPPAPLAKQPVCIPPPLQCKISRFNQACHGTLLGLMLILQQNGTERAVVPEQGGCTEGGREAHSNTAGAGGLRGAGPGQGRAPRVQRRCLVAADTPGCGNSGDENLPLSAKGSRQDSARTQTEGANPSACVCSP